MGPIPEYLENVPHIIPLLLQIIDMLGVSFPNVVGVEILKMSVISDFYQWMKKERPDVLSGIIYPEKIKI